MCYKKKYEEALERARKLYNEAKANDYITDMEDYESIFPELKENLTAFEQALVNLIGDWNDDVDELWPSKFVKKHGKHILDMAKEELLSYHDESNPAIEAMADLERAVTWGNVDNIPRWLQDELNKAFKKGQESSHEDYLRGYANGYKDAEKHYNESVAYHYPEPVPPGVVYKSPQCYTDVLITPNTNSGTSTLKAE